MVTWFATKLGASGSAGGAGLPTPGALHPNDVQVSQFDTWLDPLPFVPCPLELILLLLQTRTEAPVGFHTAPVRS